MSSSKNLQPLRKVADIKSGYTFREKVEEIENGDVHVAQIKDVRKACKEHSSTSFSAIDLPRINSSGKTKGFTEPDCVLLPSRGEYTQASYFAKAEDYSSPLIVSSQFLVIKPRTSNLDPRYLCWALNQTKIQHFLREGAGSQGTNIVMLKVADVSDIKINVPSLDTQRKIVEINDLWEQERALTYKLLANRETMLKGMFQQLIMEKE